MTDKANSVLWRWEGDAFGTSSPSIATIDMPLRMAGQYADRETGLFYNYFRFYDPETGRYVTSDPIGLEGGMNTYGYVGGNTLTYVDPFGLMRGARPRRNGTALGRQPLRWWTPRDYQRLEQQRAWARRQENIRNAQYSCICNAQLPETWVSPRSLYGRQGPLEFTGNRIKRLRRDMQNYGYNQNYPINIAIVNGRRIIIDGHHRARAAGSACIPTVPVRVIPVTPAQGLAYQSEAAAAAEALGLLNRW